MPRHLPMLKRLYRMKQKRSSQKIARSQYTVIKMALSRRESFANGHPAWSVYRIPSSEPTKFLTLVISGIRANLHISCGKPSRLSLRVCWLVKGVEKDYDMWVIPII